MRTIRLGHARVQTRGLTPQPRALGMLALLGDGERKMRGERAHAPATQHARAAHGGEYEGDEQDERRQHGKGKAKGPDVASRIDADWRGERCTEGEAVGIVVDEHLKVFGA